jgi:glyoxylase-like metal-dependent hydrolase (beta-lactamase superfamily II)
MARTFNLFALIALPIAAGTLVGQTSERQVTKLADGVYAIQHPFGNSGNTTVIIGDRQVFVVDTPFYPAFAREDIAQIRQWTDKPVAYLLNTHFHEDHNNGNRAYMDAFPALTIIAQEDTKRDMDLILPGNIERHAAEYATRIAAYKQGKDTDGRPLSEDEKNKSRKVYPVWNRTERTSRLWFISLPPSPSLISWISILGTGKCR